MTLTGREPGQTFPVVQDKCAPEAHPRMYCDSEANIPVSQIMVEMADVASFHNACRIAPSERGRAQVRALVAVSRTA